MFFIREINPLSLKLLERLYRQSRHHQVRQRAHFLILAAQGVKVEAAMSLFKVSYKTIYNWLDRWESEGIVGLYNKPGRGRKRTFNEAQEKSIRAWAKQAPRQLKQVQQKIKATWGLDTSTETIKRILKTFSMSWHRMRRTVGGEPDPIEYKAFIYLKHQMTDPHPLTPSPNELRCTHKSRLPSFESFSPPQAPKAGGL